MNQNCRCIFSAPFINGRNFRLNWLSIKIRFLVKIRHEYIFKINNITTFKATCCMSWEANIFSHTSNKSVFTFERCTLKNQTTTIFNTERVRTLKTHLESLFNLHAFVQRVSFRQKNKSKYLSFSVRRDFLTVGFFSAKDHLTRCLNQLLLYHFN